MFFKVYYCFFLQDRCSFDGPMSQSTVVMFCLFLWCSCFFFKPNTICHCEPINQNIPSTWLYQDAAPPQHGIPVKQFLNEAFLTNGQICEEVVLRFYLSARCQIVGTKTFWTFPTISYRLFETCFSISLFTNM